MSETLIRVEGVSKKFCRSLKKSLWYGLQDLGREMTGQRHGGNGELRPDEFWAVKDVSFELKRGECLGLIGRNGAGKTTLLRMLNGLIKPDTGRIEMRGRVGALIALGAGFNPILSGRENIKVNASVLGLSKREIDAKLKEVIDFAEIGEFIDSPVQSFSSGMQVRLGFAVAAALESDILLLDEVLAVGDAAFRVKCFNRIQEIIKRCAVIFVSHSMPHVTRVCSQLLLLHRGKCLTHGSKLGQVVERYHEIMDTAITPSVEGSGKVQITSVVVLNGQKKPCSTLVHGEPFSIVIQGQFADDKLIRTPKLLISISDQEDTNVAQVYELLGTLNADKKFTVRLDLKIALFNAGRYWLTVNILVGDKGELACVIRRAATFTVQHDYVGFAPIILPSTTEVISGDGPP